MLPLCGPCAQFPNYLFVCFCFCLLWGGFCPSCYVSAQQHLSESAASRCPSGAFCPRVSVSRCVFRNKVCKCFSAGSFFSPFSVRMLPPEKERSPFPLLTLSLCRWMSCSSPGCLPLTPTANHQLLLHTADSWRAKRCLTFPSDICTARTFTTGVNHLIQIQFMS